MNVKYAVLGFVMLASIGSQAWTNHIGNVRPLGPKSQVVSHSSISEGLFKEISDGKHPDLVLEFTKGDKISFRLDFAGTLFTLDDADHDLHTLTVLQTFYMRKAHSGFQFSQDQKGWKTFGDFFTGMLHSHLDVKEGRAVSRIQFEVYPGR